MPSLVKILILAVVQGLAELLPVSSSAHVVVAEKLLGLDPSSPQMTLVLVMLHTGTMFAVIFYFWSQWKQAYFTTQHAMKRFVVRAAWATVLTGVVGYPLIAIIERTAFKGHSKGEIEMLFSRLDLVAPALLAAGVLILIAGLREREKRRVRRLDRTMSDRLFSAATTLRLAKRVGWERSRGYAFPFAGSRGRAQRFQRDCLQERIGSGQNGSALRWQSSLRRWRLRARLKDF